MSPSLQELATGTAVLSLVTASATACLPLYHVHAQEKPGVNLHVHQTVWFGHCFLMTVSL
jgi:hypothetical protein